MLFRSRQENLEIENNIVLLKERLARTAGLPRGMPFALAPEIGMKGLDAKVEEILGDARRTNPGIVAQLKAVDLANEQVAILNGKDHTTLDFQFDYDKHLIFRNTDRNADVYTANVVFAWDVYDGGRNLSEQREAKEKRDQTIALLRSEERRVGKECRL